MQLRIFNSNCITVKELKEFLAAYPDYNENGEPTEVWLESGEGLTSPCKEVCALNLRGNSADIALSFTRDIMPEEEFKCRHCGSTTGYWFSRIVPMGYFCEDCGGPWTEKDGVE